MRIAIVYCTAGVINGDRQIEQLAEEEVLVTANGVKNSLVKLGYEAQPIDLCEHPLEDLLAYDWVFNLAETTVGYPLSVDQVAEWMEIAGIPFTGAGSKSLKICADKAATKVCLQRSGLATPRFEVMSVPKQYHDGLCFPLIVKPIHEEGSIGITNDSVVFDSIHLYDQVDLVLQKYRQPALVEEFIDGQDVAVSLLGTDEHIQALPISEICYAPEFTGPKFLSYNSKWVADTAAYQLTSARCPCSIDADIQNQLIELSIQACRLLDCQDYTRVDFRLQGNLPYILEINPNPCINPVSSGFVQSALAAGLSFDDLVARILRSSFARYK